MKKVFLCDLEDVISEAREEVEPLVTKLNSLSDVNIKITNKDSGEERILEAKEVVIDEENDALVIIVEE